MPKTVQDKHSGYYEAILQLRDVSDDVFDFVEKEIGKKNILVAKFQEVKNGCDFYLGNANLTKNLGKTLQEKFGGEFTVTANLFSWKDGKGIYRLTVLFRGIPFKKGEEVEYQGERHTVIVLGKKLVLQCSKTGKKVHLRYQDMGKIRKKQ